MENESSTNVITFYVAFLLAVAALIFVPGYGLLIAMALFIAEYIYLDIVYTPWK